MPRRFSSLFRDTSLIGAEAVTHALRLCPKHADVPAKLVLVALGANYFLHFIYELCSRSRLVIKYGLRSGT